MRCANCLTCGPCAFCCASCGICISHWLSIAAQTRKSLSGSLADCRAGRRSCSDPCSANSPPIGPTLPEAPAPDVPDVPEAPDCPEMPALAPELPDVPLCPETDDDLVEPLS